MGEAIPRTVQRPLQFRNGVALGVSNRWHKGQYCSIFTAAGIVGCGIYNVITADEFGQAIAVAKGTPDHPLVEPEDLLDATIVELTSAAKDLGVVVGMSGRDAVERMLDATI